MGFKVACSDIILLVPHCSVLFRFARCKTQKKHQNLAVLMLTVIKRIAPSSLVVVLPESDLVEALATRHPHPDEFGVGNRRGLRKQHFLLVLQ